MPDPATVPSPALFLIVTAAITVALVVHLRRLYGPSVALRFALPILIVGIVKEAGRSDTAYLYVVTLPRRLPVDLPLAIVGGWFTVALLGLD